MVRVLIVDDSYVARELLRGILEADSEIEIVDAIADSGAALDTVRRRRPDVVTMDISMPGMDGFEVTRRIMETCPTPIVIVTASYSPEDSKETFRAVEAGALAVLEKPRGIGHPDHDETAAEIVRTVKAMSEVKVVRRWAKPRLPGAQPADEELKRTEKKPPRPKLVAIGASTGGPVALQKLLAGLPRPCPVPVLVVQHIAPGFLAGLGDWLRQSTGHAVHIPMHGESLEGGRVYLAPDSYQMGVLRGGRVAIVKAPAEGGHRPSAAYLFRSVADVCGAEAAGVLLTGMGVDGAKELALMRTRGALTIAQDRASSVVHGMPGEAVRLGAARRVGSPEQIAEMLNEAVVGTARRGAAGHEAQ
jgi:two-component system chemotaxis response regulator CheB